MGKEIVKVVIAAAGGTFIAAYAQPKIEAYVKPTSDLGRKAVTAGTAGLSAGVAYWALSKIM
jgi:hypothetical protein